MTGFANSLLARSRGLAPVIQPNIPSAFEPGGIQESPAVTEAPPAPVVRAVAPSQESPVPQTLASPQPAAPHIEDRPQPDPALNTINSTLLIERETHREQTISRETIREQSTELRLRVEHTDREIRIPAPVPVETRVLVERIPAEPRPEPEARIAPTPQRETPALAAVQPKATLVPTREFPPYPPRSSPQLRQPFEAPPLPAPNIEVTIGRIEIRAAAPPAATARRAAPKPITLDQYLQRKQGDAR